MYVLQLITQNYLSQNIQMKLLFREEYFQDVEVLFRFGILIFRI